MKSRLEKLAHLFPRVVPACRVLQFCDFLFRLAGRIIRAAKAQFA
jgi:predicted protein tyrosine phosphatase